MTGPTPALTRLGLRLPAAVPADAGAAPLAWLSERAVAAESSGFDSLWVADRPSDVIGGAPAVADDMEPLEAYTVLGALATCTTRARLGALMTSLDSRPPSILAKQVTALDRLSRGRAVLGLATGPVDAFEDALRTCRAMLGDDATSVGGGAHQVVTAPNRPGPVQARLPIVVGGVDEQTLRVVVALADGCFVVGPPAVLQRQADRVSELCRESGRDRTELSVIALVPITGPDAAAVAEAMEPVLAGGVDGLVLEPDGPFEVDDVVALGASLVGRVGPGAR